MNRKREVPVVLLAIAMAKGFALLDRVSQFSIHVWDRAERVDESSESGRLFLKFEPPARITSSRVDR